MGGYLVAYALFLDPAPLRRRIVALLPSAGVGAVWLVAHAFAGFGASGSAMYVDPGADPFRFLGVLMERGPILLWGQWAWPPADLHYLLSAAGRGALWWMAIALAVLLVVALLLILRRHAQARFLALGMVLALVPAATTLPSGRLLIFAGIGGAGLLALLLAQLLADLLFRDVETRPFTVGERLELTGLAVEILRVEQGRPAEVAFRFDEPLESPRWRWLTWQGRSYRPFELPPVGGSAWLTLSREDGPSTP